MRQGVGEGQGGSPDRRGSHATTPASQPSQRCMGPQLGRRGSVGQGNVVVARLVTRPTHRGTGSTGGNKSGLALPGGSSCRDHPNRRREWRPSRTNGGLPLLLGGWSWEARPSTATAPPPLPAQVPGAMPRTLVARVKGRTGAERAMPPSPPLQPTLETQPGDGSRLGACTELQESARLRRRACRLRLDTPAGWVGGWHARTLARDCSALPPATRLPLLSTCAAAPRWVPIGLCHAPAGMA